MASKISSETAADGTTTTVTTVTTAAATITTTTVVQPHVVSTPKSDAVAGVDAETKKKDRDAFVGLFDTLVKDIIDEVRAFGDFDETAITWFKEVSESLLCTKKKPREGLHQYVCHVP